MKLIITLVLLMSTLSIGCAQESKRYLKLKQNTSYWEGYVLNRDSVKITGLVKDNLLNDTKKYSVVTFVQKDGTKLKLYPNTIKGYGYSNHSFISNGSSFLENVQHGRRLSLYKNATVTSWSAGGAPGMAPMTHTNVKENFYVKRSNESVFKEVRKKNFKQDFSNYFKDCEEVSNKILNEEYNHKDISEIVRKYNYCK